MDHLWPEAEVFQRFEAELIRLIPTLEDESQPRSWYWNVVHFLPGYLLIDFDVFTPITAKGHYALAWSSAGDLFQMDTHEKFIRLVMAEQLTLADNLDDILLLFGFYQAGQSKAKWVIHDITDVKSRLVAAKKQEFLSRYIGLIVPTAYCLSEGEQQVRFWAIDKPSGDLEEWLFTQKGEQFLTKFWTREKRFIKR